MSKFGKIAYKSMRLVLCGIAVLLFVQCKKADLMVAMSDVSINNWDEAATIERVNEDTVTYYDLNIVLHVNNHFRNEDIELEVTMTSPDAIRHTERVSLTCNAEWDGVTAHSNDIEIPYRRNVSLLRNGKYTIHITPLSEISGVEAVGMNFMAD